MPMKMCNRCKQLFPISGFYKHPETSDGYFNQCKSCIKIIRQEERKLFSKERKEKMEKATIEWKKGTPEKVKATARKANRKYKGKYSEKIKARGRISSLIQKGKLIKPLHCQNCHDFTYVESHHYKGYAPEHALDVIWLCLKCHRQAEKMKVS